MRVQEKDELPAGLVLELAHERAQERPLALAPLEHDALLLSRRDEQPGVDPLGDELVAAREARRGSSGDLGCRREERVDAGEQPLALRLARRIGEPLRREERRRRECTGVAEREVRQARQARLEAVHDVEAAAREREREAGANADGNAHPAPPRDRHGRAERHEVPERVAISKQRPASFAEIAGAVRRREDGHVVAALPQLPRQRCDVLVDVVRLRPGERRHESDTHAPMLWPP